MIEILQKLFEAQPEKSVIILNGKCSDCGCDTTIEITPTSGGFGLQGGALCEYSSDDYTMKCCDCYQVNPIIKDMCKIHNRDFQNRKVVDCGFLG